MKEVNAIQRFRGTDEKEIFHSSTSKKYIYTLQESDFIAYKTINKIL